MGGVVTDVILLARAFLSRVAEPACIPVWDLVRRLGPVEAARVICDGMGSPDVSAATAARRDHVDAQADLDAAQRHGIRLVVPESADWPHFAFAALERTGQARVRRFDKGERTVADSGEPMPPLALWVKGPGDLASLGVRSVGIVGSRAATAYGEHVTADLGYGLAGRGVVVVSGGAYGIDAAAHRGALAAGGPTVIVSAGGLDRPYPTGNSSLFARAAESGLVVSESPPGAAPQRHRFLTRNRLIAALSTGTVVVEAARRSGAANTAHHCLTQGRPVMAVPGPVTSPMSAGCHDLLRRENEPALLVTCVDDVLAVVGAMGDGLPPDHRPATPAAGGDLRAELDVLDPVARRVFEGLPARRSARPDEIAQRCGVSPIEVIRSLPVLDLAGLLEATDAGYRIAARLRPRRAEV
ncbi:MAG: DNA-protecting protein DprA [Pseudonocardiales bacterium]|nr:MAG: DNA-protecting protein DprA [Pseudonocardiales bacterium]